MTQRIANPISAIVAVLTANSLLASHTSNRIYGGKLDDEIESMPTASIVVQESGGGSVGQGARGRSLWRVARLDIRCYGDTDQAADDTFWIMHEAMVAIERRVAADCIVHDAVVTGGPLPGLDGDAPWPYTMGVYDVSYAPLHPPED